MFSGARCARHGSKRSYSAWARGLSTSTSSSTQEHPGPAGLLDGPLNERGADAERLLCRIYTYECNEPASRRVALHCSGHDHTTPGKEYQRAGPQLSGCSSQPSGTAAPRCHTVCCDKTSRETIVECDFRVPPREHPAQSTVERLDHIER